MHTEAYEWVAAWVRGRMFRSVLEFGSLDINGSVRGAFNTARYHGIDIQEGPGVDELADARFYRLADRSADVVVCCEVLEHAPDVQAIVNSAFANLRPGGLFLVTCATDPRQPHSAVDGGPVRVDEHYENVRQFDLEVAAEGAGFHVQQALTHDDRGDLYLRAKKQ